MRDGYYVSYERSTRKLWHARFAALHSADKKISAAGPRSQSAILSAKPALLTNHQQSKISSVRRVQSFSRTDKLVVPLFPQSSTQASLNTAPLTAFVRPPSATRVSYLSVRYFFFNHTIPPNSTPSNIFPLLFHSSQQVARISSSAT